MSNLSTHSIWFPVHNGADFIFPDVHVCTVWGQERKTHYYISAFLLKIKKWQNHNITLFIYLDSRWQVSKTVTIFIPSFSVLSYEVSFIPSYNILPFYHSCIYRSSFYRLSFLPLQSFLPSLNSSFLLSSIIHSFLPRH